jgi:hypothetical protein
MKLDLTNLQIDNIGTALQLMRAMTEATLQEIGRQVQAQQPAAVAPTQPSANPLP